MAMQSVLSLNGVSAPAPGAELASPDNTNYRVSVWSGTATIDAPTSMGGQINVEAKDLAGDWQYLTQVVGGGVTFYGVYYAQAITFTGPFVAVRLNFANAVIQEGDTIFGEIYSS